MSNQNLVSLGRSKRHLQGFCDEVRENTYVLPVEFGIMRDEKEKLDKAILDYVRENKRDGRMAPRKKA